MMACFVNLGQLLLFIMIFFQHTTSLPVFQSNQEDMEENSRSMANQMNPLPRSYDGALLEAKRSVSHESGLHTRQLGDIEFSNRYAEYLRSKAKLNNLCSLLHRMKNIKNSLTEVDTERVNELLKLYMCPSTYQWASGL